jgi:hypothetical protein
MSNMLAEVGTRARLILKALKGEGAPDPEKKDPKGDEGSTAAVPDPPDDPDRMDPRVEDASPKEKDLDQAKDDQAGKTAPQGDGDGSATAGDDAAGGDGADAGDVSGGGDADGAGDGGGEGFDEFGHRDMDPREIRKAFPEVGHLFPAEALEYIEEHEDPANKEAKGLELIQEAIRGFGDVLAKITAELNDLKKGHEVQGRELKKALDSNTALQARLDKIHETAPAAGAPRAINKALGDPAGAAAQGFTHGELTTLAASGKMSSAEISMLCLTGRRQ